MAERVLHHMQRGAFCHHLGASVWRTSASFLCGWPYVWWDRVHHVVGDMAGHVGSPLRLATQRATTEGGTGGCTKSIACVSGAWVLPVWGHRAYCSLVGFKRLPKLTPRGVCVQSRRMWICMPQHPLPTIKALAVLR
jgi:hypothetical protein